MATDTHPPHWQVYARVHYPVVKPPPHTPQPPITRKGTMRRVTTLNHSHGQGTQQRA